MSKSLWSRSVWNSLFNRIPKSRGSSRPRRKSLLTHRDYTLSAEMLEQRVVPAAVSFDSSLDTLTVSTAADNESITIKAGSTYTDILVNGKFQTRVAEANSNNIGTIVFTGENTVGSVETLNVIGVNGVAGSVAITLNDTERILLNTKNVTITQNDNGLAFGKTTVAGTLTLTLADAGAVTQFGKMNVSGTTTIATVGLAATDDIILSSSGNSFGMLVLSADDDTTILGGGDISINEAGPTTLGTVTAQSLIVKSTGAISDNGEIHIGEASTNVGTTTLTSSGAITLDDNLSTFAGTINLKGTNILVKDNDITEDVPLPGAGPEDTIGGTTLGTVTATGTFSLYSAEAVTATGNVKVTGLATIDTTIDALAAADAITMTAGTNNFGSLALNGAAIMVTEKSAMNLGPVTATGNVEFRAKGAITDSDEINITGTTLLAAAGGAITLDEDTSTFTGNLTVGAVGYNATNVSIINDTATAIAGVAAKGTFTLTSAGTVSQPAGVISSVGRTTIDAAGSTITLNNANTFGSLSLFGTTVGVTETGGTNLFTSEITGNFTFNSTGAAIIDSGDISVNGTTDITATAAAITLDQSGSYYTGAIRFTGSNVAITNSVATTIGNGDDASAATSTATGNLTLISTDDITDEAGVLVADDDVVAVGGRLTATSTGDVILGTATNTFGSISVSGVNVTIVDSTLGLDIVSAAATGDFSVTTTGGDLSDSGNVTVTGNTTATVTTGGNLTLNSAGSTFNGTFTGTGRNLTLVDSDTNGITITSMTMTDVGTGDGSMTVTAGGTITVSTVSGLNTSLTMNAGSGGDISVAASSIAGAGASTISPVTLTGVNATLALTDGVDNAITLGNNSLSGFFSLTGTGVGAVTQVASTKQTIAGSVTIDTDDNATANAITLSNIGNTFGTLTLIGAAISVREAAATDFAGTTATGSLTVISNGAVTDSGTVAIDGTTSITATGNNITLDSTTNSFDGALTLTGANITIDDDTNTALAAVTASGTFTLLTEDAVTQTGNVVVGGLATITTGTAAGDDITLTTGTINFGSLALTGDNIDIDEDSATNFASVTATTLDVLSAGAITDSGTLTVTAGSTFKAGANGLEKITLDDASSTFGDLTFDGGTVTLVENGPTTLTNGTTSLAGGAASNDVDGNMTITTTGGTGDVTHAAGALSVDGVLTITAVSGSSNAVSLNGATDDFGSVSITAASATIDETSAGGTDLATSSVTGAFTLTSAATVTDSGVLTLGGVTTITVTAGSIELDEVGSSYVDVDLTATTGITLLAYSGLEITDATTTAGDIIIIASGAITDGAAASTISGVNVFIQAGLDEADPTRELDPTDPADFALLNAVDLDQTNPTFTGTETYVGSIVNVL